MPLMLIIRKHCTTGALKLDYTSIQNNFANPATGIKPLIPNFDRVEFGAYGIVSYDLSDSFR
jgi:hypothetical protein